MAEHTITYTEYPSYQAMPAQLQHLATQALHACDKSYAPYSKFHVGAVALLQDGTLMQGCNQENAASPAGLCAERTVLYSTGVRYPDAIIQTLAIAACRHKKAHQTLPITPCGGCRQVIKEFEERQNQPIQLLIPSLSGRYILLPSADSLLPFSFSGSQLLS